MKTIKKSDDKLWQIMQNDEQMFLNEKEKKSWWDHSELTMKMLNFPLMEPFINMKEPWWLTELFVF